MTERILLDVPLIAQLPELPRGCEVTSLAMLLQHAGVKVDKLTLAEQVTKVPFEENGLRGHPNDGFVGDMYSFETPGICTYHSPITKLAQEYLDKRIVDITGCDWSEIEETLYQGIPVWVIVTSRYRFLEEEFWETWQTRHGELKITYKEHAVVLTGYDEDNVYFNDPLDYLKDRPIPKNDFIAGWKQLGQQAITYTL